MKSCKCNIVLNKIKVRQRRFARHCPIRLNCYTLTEIHYDMFAKEKIRNNMPKMQREIVIMTLHVVFGAFSNKYKQHNINGNKMLGLPIMLTHFIANTLCGTKIRQS